MHSRGGAGTERVYAKGERTGTRRAHTMGKRLAPPKLVLRGRGGKEGGEGTDTNRPYTMEKRLPPPEPVPREEH